MSLIRATRGTRTDTPITLDDAKYMAYDHEDRKEHYRELFGGAKPYIINILLIGGMNSYALNTVKSYLSSSGAAEKASTGEFAAAIVAGVLSAALFAKTIYRACRKDEKKSYQR